MQHINRSLKDANANVEAWTDSRHIFTSTLIISIYHEYVWFWKSNNHQNCHRQKHTRSIKMKVLAPEEKMMNAVLFIQGQKEETQQCRSLWRLHSFHWWMTRRLTLIWERCNTHTNRGHMHSVTCVSAMQQHTHTHTHEVVYLQQRSINMSSIVMVRVFVCECLIYDHTAAMFVSLRRLHTTAPIMPRCAVCSHFLCHHLTFFCLAVLSLWSTSGP